MATITKRGNRQWQAKVRRKGQPGMSKTFETKTEAQAWAAVIEGKMVTSEFRDYRKAAKTTLREVLEDYEEKVVPSKKGHQLRYAVRAWMERPLADRYIGSITPADVLDWIRERLASKYTVYEKTRKGDIKRDADGKPIIRYTKAIAPKTVANELMVLSAVFTHAELGMGMEALENPVAKIKKGDRPRGRPRNRRLSEDKGEYAKLLEALDADRNPYAAALLEFAVETAMRRGEMAALRWRDVDLFRRQATLRGTKNGTDRIIGLSTKAVQILEGLPSRPALGAEPGADDRVFPLAADSITQIFMRARERCDIQGRHSAMGLTFHDLRHEGTSRLFEKGLNVMEAANQTGHQTLQMLKRYTHPDPAQIAVKLG
ncbi:site-specific integrase [Magnetospirillum sp. SS-4]|uniref:integrase n=1 Tax=Magnetospirillum sp. SS-4 TaxID=2681465 RepID=UPI00138532BE|nr:site-specific integrase [Magnetospirillum sp. SS-4]CAA7619058.1 Phage integrase family protein [Magnetospirillum sp. SS-4]